MVNYFNDIFQKEEAGRIPVRAICFIGICRRAIDLNNLNKRERLDIRKKRINTRKRGLDIRRRCRDNKRKDLEKGSITIETAFVTALALLVIFVVLAICFYMHNRAWYSATAGETAIATATYAVRKDGEYGEIMSGKINSFANGPGFPDSGQGLFGESSGEQIKVGAKPQVPVPMTSQSLQADVDIKSKVIKPVKFIRTIQSLQMIKEQIDAG